MTNEEWKITTFGLLILLVFWIFVAMFLYNDCRSKANDLYNEGFSNRGLYERCDNYLKSCQDGVERIAKKLLNMNCFSNQTCVIINPGDTFTTARNDTKICWEEE